eukprot:7260173-Alexandrium_andersonii.AAC.1
MLLQSTATVCERKLAVDGERMRKARARSRKGIAKTTGPSCASSVHLVQGHQLLRKAAAAEAIPG